jgi:hypothetical protein
MHEIHDEHSTGDGAASPLARLSETEQAALAGAIMRRQIALSIRIFLVFAVLLFGLPLFNYLLPQVANGRIGGFTLTWLFLGVLFYPLTWALSAYFIKESDRIEHDLAREHSGLAGAGGAAKGGDR